MEKTKFRMNWLIIEKPNTKFAVSSQRNDGIYNLF